ncbi:hypothetical protein B0H13DRAFT_1876264 [Mycena leptocephala]|nr:hypothetical protein B0H13DRAFT_1876264 [Mycena leptocephala]
MQLMEDHISVTPRLWARLHIAEPTRFEAFGVAPTGVPPEMVQRLEITKTWLGRSGQCPLSISFDSGQEHPGLPNGPPASGFPNTYLFLQAMISFASRWQNITLSVSWSALNTLSNLTESDVPMLTKLDINQRTEAVTPNIEWAPSGCFRRSASWTFPCVGKSDVSRDHGPRLGGVHLWYGAGGSLQVPQVRVCRLLVNEDPSATVTDGSGISTVLELPHLHSFYLTSIGLPLDNIGSILRRLSVPALRHFDLRGRSNIGDQHPTFVSSFVAFLGTSQRYSKTVSYRAPPRAAADPKAAAHHGPRHSWVIDGMKGVLDDDALAVLTPSPPELPVSCPVLEELHITHCTSPSDAALLRFITMRMAVQPVTLKRVEIQFSREMDVDIQADIEPFVDAGLRVSTRYHHTPAAGNFSPWQGLPDAPGMWL